MKSKIISAKIIPFVILLLCIGIGWFLHDFFQTKASLSCSVSYIGTYSRSQVYKIATNKNASSELYKLTSRTGSHIYVVFTFSEETAIPLEYAKLGIFESIDDFAKKLPKLKDYLNPVAYKWLEKTVSSKSQPDQQMIAITGIDIEDRATEILTGQTCLL